jgi:hypothetical protein
MNADEKYRLSVYKVISALSENKDKRIYLVKEEVSQRLYVKKIFRRVDRFDFYKRLAALRHRNLALIHDVIKDGGEMYVIEEYISGQTLKDLMENAGAMPDAEAARYALQLCDALAYLHGQSPPVIHRDIKPDNILCSADGVVKLVDFDIAREFKEDAKRDTVFMGTREYAAPEQYGYRQTDCRADIFSVGVLLHELVTGRLPENNITYNGALRKIIDKCVEIDPEKRFQNVSSLKKALAGARLKPRGKIAVFAAALILSCLAAVFLWVFPRYGGILGGSHAASAELSGYMEKIKAHDEKPLIFLEDERIDSAVRNITGDMYENVKGAFQEYNDRAGLPASYNADGGGVYLPACNALGGYIHDMLLFEMEGAFLSLSYYDYDLEAVYYFTTAENKGRLTPGAFNWIQSNPLLYENPVVFNQSNGSGDDITGAYYRGGTKKIEIFEGEGGIKFSYTDISGSREAEPLITETIYKIDDSHYWMKNVTSGGKNRLVFNFAENHLTLFTGLYDEMLYFEGIYEKE